MLVPCPSCQHRNPAAASFCEECGTWIGNRALRSRPSASTQWSNAERRQLTIMFCDLVESVARSIRLDPEDLQRIMRDYYRLCEDVIVRSGGYVAKYLGDGVLAYFGYPHASEADAEQAVRTGLTLIEGIGQIETGDVHLQARVGIATGLVVIGDLFTSGAVQEQAAIGQTPNLAARLQQLAEPNSVVIGETTKRLTGGLFTYRALEPMSLKGFDGTVAAWKVLGPSGSVSRFEARAEGGLTPFINRDQDLAFLSSAWQQVVAGDGQVVLLSGEPGIGKSRIVQTLRQHLGERSHTALFVACSPQQQDSALYTVISRLESISGFARSDTEAEKLGKLETLLARSGSATAEDVALLADLLSLPVTDRTLLSSIGPQRRKQRTLDALISQLIGLSRQRPVVLVWEDVHWSDPTSLELLTLIIECVPRLPVLLIVTFRPEFSPPWAGDPNVTWRTLPRLGGDHGAALSEGVTGKVLPAEVQRQIVEKSDGNPLFIEELTKTVVESGLLQDQGSRYVLTGALTSLTVPGTLHDSLVARLDRLGPLRELLHIGAAIGREFPHELLAAVSPLSDAELDEAVDGLLRSELVFLSEQKPDRIYTFKHALIRDAAYELMLRSKRQELHGHIAQVLKQRFSDWADTRPEALAHHFTEAGELLTAIPHWQQAGLRAQSRAAYVEAAGHFRTALDLVGRLGEAGSLPGVELGLRTQLAMSLSATRGYAAPEVQDAYDQALRLCDILGDTSDVFPVLRGICTFSIVRADLPRARDIAVRCTQIGEQAQRMDYLIEGYNAWGYTLIYMGELAEGRRLLEKAVELYRSHGGYRLSYPTPQDPAVACLSLLATACWEMGDLATGIRCSEEAVAAARRLNRPFDLAYAHCFAASFELLRRRPLAAHHHAETAVEISREHGYGVWLTAGTMHLAMAMGATGRIEEATAMLTATLEAWRSGGAELNRSYYIVGLANLHRVAGRPEEALRAIEEGIEHAERHRNRSTLASLYLARGEALMQQGGTALGAAEAVLMRALDTARQQGARLYELRAVLRLRELASQTSSRLDQFDAELDRLRERLSQDNPELGHPGPDWILDL